MISTIYQALETRLKAHTSFATFGFFRFLGESNSNQKTKASAPYLNLIFVQNQSQNIDVLRWRIDWSLSLRLDIVWNAAQSNVNDITRITEQSSYVRAVNECIFRQAGEENFLNLANVLNVKISSEPLEIGGLEVMKQNGVRMQIQIDYVENF